MSKLYEGQALRRGEGSTMGTPYDDKAGQEESYTKRKTIPTNRRASEPLGHGSGMSKNRAGWGPRSDDNSNEQTSERTARAWVGVGVGIGAGRAPRSDDDVDEMGCGILLWQWKCFAFCR